MIRKLSKKHAQYTELQYLITVSDEYFKVGA